MNCREQFEQAAKEQATHLGRCDFEALRRWEKRWSSSEDVNSQSTIVRLARAALAEQDAAIERAGRPERSRAESDELAKVMEYMTQQGVPTVVIDARMSLQNRVTWLVEELAKLRQQLADATKPVASEEDKQISELRTMLANDGAMPGTVPTLNHDMILSQIATLEARRNERCAARQPNDAAVRKLVELVMELTRDREAARKERSDDGTGAPK